MSEQDRSLKRTVGKIKRIRDRFDQCRREGRGSAPVHNSEEYDIIAKALELLRQTITIGNRST